jgi:hypothetical protein
MHDSIGYSLYGMFASSVAMLAFKFHHIFVLDEMISK